ncbi:cadherin-like domain-containing protein [Legionella sp. CNM-4043-24]|uniref:cadherin-like domain-containing protein n=1 Tax=Legionella sp. CNM-4043-24 TaxID=3421646 RepID=UPI00403AC207
MADIQGDDNDNIILGTLLSDRIMGGLGNDNINGRDSNDSINGDEGNDRLVGGSGDDTVSGDAGNDSISGGLGNDTLDGGLGDDWISGDDGNDSISGGDGHDRLYGGVGDDSINGDVGNDRIGGGAGIDTLSGGSGNDIIDGDDGNDLINGGDGNDRLAGGRGDDSINGDANRDSISGGIGNDTLSGGLGDDWLSGDDGNDTLSGGDGDDVMYGGLGDDTINGDAGQDSINGGAGIDTLFGGSGDDTINGEDDNDIISGGDGVDRLVGGAGDDNISGDADNDSISGGIGNDTINGGLGDDWLSGDDGNDIINGGDGNDRLHGGRGNDSVYGGDGDDVIYHNVSQNAGNIDVYDGGAGNNTFILQVTKQQYAAIIDAGLTTDFASNPAGNSFDFNPYSAALGFDLNISVAGFDDLVFIQADTNTNDVAPVITSPDNFSALEDINDTTVIGQVTFTDQDTVNGTTTYRIVNDVDNLFEISASGEISLQAGKQLNFESQSSHSISVVVNDGAYDSAPQIITIGVQDVNEAPTAGAAVALSAIAEDSGARLITQADLLANAGDVDAGSSLQALNLSIASGSGTLVDNLDGTWTYTPALNDDSSVSFGFEISDGSLSTATTASLDITPVNDTPVAGASVVLNSIAEDSGARLITQAELLANASDVDAGSSLQALNLSIASGSGSLVNNNDGTWSYTPALNDNSSVSFDFAISDGSSNVSSHATLDITPVNDTPVAGGRVNLTAILEDSGSRVITQADLLANASDVDSGSLQALNLSIASGSGTLVDNLNGTWSYTPALNDDSRVDFDFDISDGNSSVASTARMNINSVNDAPSGGYFGVIIDDITTYNFTGSEFGFSDVNDAPANNFQSVIIVSIPTAAGTLFFDGQPVVAGQEIAASELNKLSYTKSSNMTISFDFQVRDDGGTANGGVDTDPGLKTVTFLSLGGFGFPVALDLDGSGHIDVVSQASSNLRLDVDGDGVLDQLASIGSHDGLLVYDNNHDGLVTQMDEISFVGYHEGAKTDLEGLQAFDSNHNGQLDAGDARFSSFSVWQDSNGNGVSDAGEMKSLSASGIASIGLSSNHQVQAGADSVIFGEGQFSYSNGETGMLADMGLRYAAVGSAQSSVNDLSFTPGELLSFHPQDTLMQDILNTLSGTEHVDLAAVLNPLQSVFETIQHVIVQSQADASGGVDGAPGVSVSSALDQLLTTIDSQHSLF